MLKEYYSLEAEQSVLGSLMSDDNTDCLVAAELKHTDFFLEKHRYIFKGIEILMSKEVNPDTIAVLGWLGDNDLLELVGVQSLFDITENHAGNGNFKYHQKIVKDHSRRRTVQKTLSRMQEKLIETGEIEELEEMLLKGIDALTNVTTSTQTSFTKISDIMYDLVEDLEIDKGEIQGVATGFTEFDKMTTGLKGGDFVVIGARPSMGKTAWALNVSMGSAKNGAIVPIYSLEMKNGPLGRRMLSSNANVEGRRLKQGGSALSNDDWLKIGHGSGELSTLDIMISDVSGVQIGQIRKDMERLRKLHPDREILCLIDYLQLISGGPKYAGNRQQEISEISRELKKTALECNVIIVALSQLSRQVEQRQDKRPVMSDLRESGSIEQDADIIGFLYRDDYYDRESAQKNIVELILTKQRDGEVGTVELAFVKEFGKMVNLERRFDN